jgi:hypothetical protein
LSTFLPPDTWESVWLLRPSILHNIIGFFNDKRLSLAALRLTWFIFLLGSHPNFQRSKFPRFLALLAFIFEAIKATRLHDPVPFTLYEPFPASFYATVSHHLPIMTEGLDLGMNHSCYFSMAANTKRQNFSLNASLHSIQLCSS